MPSSTTLRGHPSGARRAADQKQHATGNLRGVSRKAALHPVPEPWGGPHPVGARPACRTAALSWWPFQHDGGNATLQPPQAPVKQRPAGSKTVVQETSAAELQAHVQQHCSSTSGTAPPLILMFTAEWCGPCTLVHKELTKLGALRPAGSFTVLSLDVDASPDNSQLATDLGIYTLPTLIFVGRDEGKPSISTTGNVSMTLVADVLDNKMGVCGASLKNRLRM